MSKHTKTFNIIRVHILNNIYLDLDKRWKKVKFR